MGRTTAGDSSYNLQHASVGAIQSASDPATKTDGSVCGIHCVLKPNSRVMNARCFPGEMKQPTGSRLGDFLIHIAELTRTEKDEGTCQATIINKRHNCRARKTGKEL